MYEHKGRGWCAPVPDLRSPSMWTQALREASSLWSREMPLEYLEVGPEEPEAAAFSESQRGQSHLPWRSTQPSR